MAQKGEAKVRRSSFVQQGENPLADGAADAAGGSVLKIENLANARPITEPEMDELANALEAMEDNKARLAELEQRKQSFLFSISQLLRIVQITESVKTRIAMVQHLGPRLTDPRNKTELLALFRFSDEKRQVEDVLKAREQFLSKSQFVPPAGRLSVGGRTIAGRGRGRGGRGRGMAIARPDTLGSVEPRAASPADETPAQQEQLETHVGELSMTKDRSTPEPQESPKSPKSPPRPEVVPPSLPTVGVNTGSEAATLHDPAPPPPPPPSSTQPRSPSIARFFLPINPTEHGKHTKQQLEPNPPPPATPPPSPAAGGKHATANGEPRLGDAAVSITDPPSDDVSQPAAIVEEENVQNGSGNACDASNSEPANTASQVEPTMQPSGTAFEDNDIRTQNLLLASLGLTMESADEITEVWEQKPQIIPTAFSVPSDTPPNGAVESLQDNLLASLGLTESDAAGMVEVWEELVHQCEPDAEVNHGNEASEKKLQDRENDNAATATMAQASQGDHQAPSNRLQGSATRRASLWALQRQRQPAAAAKKFTEQFSNKDAVPAAAPRESTPSPTAELLMANLHPQYSVYAEMEPEDAVGFRKDGQPTYSYKELVRRSVLKNYGDLNLKELETYLSDNEFEFRFNMSREQFMELPQWRKTERKKMLNLF